MQTFPAAGTTVSKVVPEVRPVLAAVIVEVPGATPEAIPVLERSK